jgi:hypothetical protein
MFLDRHASCCSSLSRGNRLVSCHGFAYYNAARCAKGTKHAKDSFIDGSRSVRQGNEVRQGLLIPCPCLPPNILGALRSLGELNLTHVAFSKKLLAHFVPLAHLAALKYAQTRQVQTFNASTGRVI